LTLRRPIGPQVQVLYHLGLGPTYICRRDPGSFLGPFCLAGESDGNSKPVDNSSL